MYNLKKVICKDPHVIFQIIQVVYRGVREEEYDSRKYKQHGWNVTIEYQGRKFEYETWRGEAYVGTFRWAPGSGYGQYADSTGKWTRYRQEPYYKRGAEYFNWKEGLARQSPIPPSVVEIDDYLKYDVGCVRYEETFKEFCSEFGYSDDSIKALEIYDSIKRMKRKLEYFFGRDFTTWIESPDSDIRMSDEQERASAEEDIPTTSTEQSEPNPTEES